MGEPNYRINYFEGARPVMQDLSAPDRERIERYANSEYWAGWNAAIAHAEHIARNRHKCWQESTLGSSQPEDDISACGDIALAISHEKHAKPPAGRPLL